MRIAIHHRKDSFSEQWIEYCENNNIEYKVVNAYDSDIIQQLKNYDIFMWHYHHADYRDIQISKSILFSLEQAGIKVFPDFKTSWYFDDKVAQKYLLESVNAPLVPSFVFYDKKQAINWAQKTNYPKVFKLKGGAGASNVKLANNKKQALKLINKSFGKGFKQNDYWYEFKDRWGKYQANKMRFFQTLSPLFRIIKPRIFDKLSNNEKGYVYFQEFIPNNNSDIRVIVIGQKKAFGIKRMVRENDFRASGSGNIVYDIEKIPMDCVALSFEIAHRLESQCIAFDFVFDNDKPLIVEVSYGFAPKAYDKCEGYWDSDLVFHKEKIMPQFWMVQNMIKNFK